MNPELPEIRTERLQLRRMHPADWPAIEALYAETPTDELDPMQLRGANLRAKFEVWVADWAERGLSYWLAEFPAAGQVIGMGGIRYHTEDGEPVLNLAYRLQQTHWGRGYAAEIARPAVEWAEANLPHIPVSVVTTPRHAQSLRVAAKLGFTQVAERDIHGFAEVLLRRTPPD